MNNSKIVQPRPPQISEHGKISTKVAILCLIGILSSVIVLVYVFGFSDWSDSVRMIVAVMSAIILIVSVVYTTMKSGKGPSGPQDGGGYVVH